MASDPQNMTFVDYNQLIPRFIEAVKELKALSDTQATKVALSVRRESGMTPYAVSLLLSVCFLFLCSEYACAAPQYNATQITDVSGARCGQTITDALNAARAALASNDAKLEHAALVCLLAAVAALDKEVEALETGDQHSGVIKVPQHPDANQRGP